MVSTGTVSKPNVSLQIGTWFDMFCEWWLSSYNTLVHLPLLCLGNDWSAEKMDYPVFQHSPRTISHKLNLYTTSEAIAESIMFSSDESDRAAS